MFIAAGPIFERHIYRFSYLSIVLMGISASCIHRRTPHHSIANLDYNHSGAPFYRHNYNFLDQTVEKKNHIVTELINIWLIKTNMIEFKYCEQWLGHDTLAQCCSCKSFNPLRMFTQKFSDIDFFLKILPLKENELVMSEMWKK